MDQLDNLTRDSKPLTAGQLRTWLANVPDDTAIVLSKDGEGSDFSPLAEADPDSRYVAESTWSGYVLDSDEDDVDESERVVVLWPTN